MRPATPLSGRVLGICIAAVALLAALYLATGLYSVGHPLWGLVIVALVGVAVVVYSRSEPSAVAWRYLFPGVAGMLIFVLVPMLYTFQVGLTNYSSSNLLTRERATAYLLDQVVPDDASVHEYSVRREGEAFVLVLADAAGQRYESAPFAATGPNQLSTRTTDARTATSGTGLSMRELIAMRERLQALRVRLPDGREIAYAGLREFANLVPLWTRHDSGLLKRTVTGELFRANDKTGFYENDQGERVTPGFTVNVGLANFERMAADDDFRAPFLSIFVWTILFAALTTVFVTIVGTTLAVLLNWEALRYRTAYRTLLFLPYAVPAFISILVFKGLFNQNFGEINALLSGVFGMQPAWFADPLLAKVMLLIVNTWLGFPYIMVLVAALLKSIPADLYEASAIVGAGPLSNFWRITWPLVWRPLSPLLVAAFAFNFNNFVLITLLTNGRPDFLNTKIPAGTNDILVSYVYRIAFQDTSSDFGLAAAISVVVFVLVMIFSVVNLRLLRVNEQKGQ